MIKITFKLGGEILEVMVRGNEILFYDIQTRMTTPLAGLKLSKAGVIKEFPDLKDKEDWKQQAIERFKEHINKMQSETEKMNYLIEDLKKYGYEPLYFQRAGHRPQKIK